VTRATARDQFVGAALGGLGSCDPVYLGSARTGICPGSGRVRDDVLSAQDLGKASCGITATIILLVPHVGSPVRMVLSRVAEVGWGASVEICSRLADGMPARETVVGQHFQSINDLVINEAIPSTAS
jgi:hypothetical protein